MSQVVIKPFTPLHCATCAIEFGVPQALYIIRQRDHSNFYCPNGHSNVFPKAKVDEDVEDDEEEEEEEDPTGASDEDASVEADASGFTPKHSEFKGTILK